MFDRLYKRIILLQILSNIELKYKRYIIRYLSSLNIFKYYLNLGFSKSDIDMYNSLILTYEEDKTTAILSMLAWKTITLKKSYYIVLDIVNLKTYDDGTLNISFLRYDLKLGQIRETIYQIYGQNKAIYYSMLKSNKSLDYIFNFLYKRGMCLL